MILIFITLNISNNYPIFAKNYAVLISAGKTKGDDKPYNSEYWYDLFLIYEILYENGFTHSNIHVLYGDGNDFQSSHSRYQIPSGWGISQITDLNNSESNVQDVFSDLAPNMTNQDFLWIWWMGHGAIDSLCSDIYFNIQNTGEKVYDHEFKSYVDQINNYKKRSFSIMTCHSGGIIDELENNKTVILTAVPCGKKAYSYKYDVWHAEFTHNLYSALNWGYPGGGSVNADDNSNGLISMYEAWDYTYDNRTYDEADIVWRSIPQYSDLGNLGSNMYIFCSGTLIRNVHLLDDIDFTGDVIIYGDSDFYRTLTIDQNVTVTFSANNDDQNSGYHTSKCELIIQGKLSTNGTSFESSASNSGDWYGIVFDNAQTNNSTVQNSTIKHATYGIICDNTNPDLENNSVKNNSGNGIKCHEASPTIYHNTLESNGIGILCESNSSPYINNNYVVNNTSYGIYCTQTSHPDIRHNEFSNNGPGGVCCLNSSSPMLVGRNSSEPYGANKIISNGGSGVLVFTNSNPNLGFHFGCQAGYNDIYNHSNKQVANYTGNTILAWRNWWGTANPGSELFYGSVDYSAPLTSSSPYAGPDWSQSLAKSLEPIVGNSLNDVEEYLLKALESEGAGNFEEAIENYRYVTDQYSETYYGPFALSRLMACRVKQGDITVEKNYLYSAQQKNDINQTGTTALLWQPLVEVRAGNEQEALEICDNIKNRYSDANLIKDAKFLKGSIQLYEIDDVEAAKKTYDEFTKEYPKDPLIEHIKIILENYQSYDSSLPKTRPQNRAAAPVMPTHFQLSQNFPNPFNPETEIQYQLPEDSHVKIEIFNIMGQKICTLMNKQQSTGFYSVRWDGSDENGSFVASGVYVYIFQTNELMDVKKMVLLR